MPRGCFIGNYRNKTKTDNKESSSDAFDMIATALKCNISYSELKTMSFVMLSNIVDALAPKKPKPTQAQIDLIT